MSALKTQNRRIDGGFFHQVTARIHVLRNLRFLMCERELALVNAVNDVVLRLFRL